jgi:hypothetical protein
MGCSALRSLLEWLEKFHINAFTWMLVMKLILILAELFLIGHAQADPLADQELQTLACRPTVACTSDLVPAGQTEVEFGLFYQAFSGGWQNASPFLFKLSLLDSLQVQVGGNGLESYDGFGHNARYFDDPSVGLKYRFLSAQGYIPSMAISWASALHVQRPAGFNWDKDMATYYASETFVHLHFDFNYGLIRWRGEGRELQTFAALCISGNLARQLTVGIEGATFSEAGPVAGQNDEVTIDLQYSPRTWLTFDVGVNRSFFHSYTSQAYSGGVTWVPGRLW